MTTSLCFAHITDIHISDQGDTQHVLGAQAPRLLRDTLAQFNRMDDLDFVLITGDVLDLASPAELERFTDALAILHKPWHFVPGNHDGYIDPARPGAYEPHQAVSLIDPRMISPTPHAQKACWSRTIKPGIQLVGLDSRMPDDWGGEIGMAQQAWLRDELEQHCDDLMIIAVHHPLHDLGPHNAHGLWSKFVCDNGAQVEALLDRYPNVKLVIAGHHHANQIRRRGTRLHVTTAALSGYPCVYRIMRITAEDNGWRIQTETHPAADEGTLKRAHDMILDSRIAELFAPDDPAAWCEFCLGRPEDQGFDGRL